MHRLRRYWHLPRDKRGLLLECLLALASAAWQVRVWRFSRLAASLGAISAPTPQAGGAMPGGGGGGGGGEDAKLAQEVRWAVGACCRALPLQPTCLMQAVAARRLLLRRGVGCDIYFGVRGGKAQMATAGRALSAHAWLRCGRLLVTGEKEAARFQAIAVCRCTPVQPGARR